MVNKQITQNATFSIAKGLNHLQNSIGYFEIVKIEMNASFQAKNFLNDLLKRLNWVNQQVILKLKTNEAKEALKEEMQNAATLDSLMNIVVALPEAMRLEVEQFANERLTEFQEWKKQNE